MTRNILLSALFLTLFVGCKNAEGPQEIAERTLVAYLRCSLSDVEQVAYPQVVEQVRWRVSNITKDEMQQMLQTEPDIEVEECSQEGDMCRVMLRASDALLIGDVKQKASIGEQRFSIILVKDTENASWRVATIEALP